MKKLILILAVLLTSIAFAQNVPPAIFYSDLTSGPNTGGVNNAGAFVTIHGNGFGASQGSSTVTVGGGAAASYQSWSNTAVTFQLGAAAKTGGIAISAGGVTSNGVPFTVRSGNIYFVSTSGSDTGSGSYTSPWKTLAHAVSVMTAGSIAYVENGYTQSTELVLGRGGSTSSPLAILGYPGSSVTVGATTGLTTGVSITASNWVLANLILRGTQTALSVGNVTGIRLAGSDISCPNATATGACISTSGGSSFAFLGNSIHNNGLASSTNLASYQAVSLLNTNGVEIGWNLITNTLGCNAIGAHSSYALQYSYKVHDNYIYKTPCEAIALGTVNPSRGAVSVYNNVIQSSGTGPAPAGTSQGYGYAAIVIGGGASTPAQVYNNTIYDAGGLGGESAGAVRALGAVNLTNNIFYLLSSEQYASLDTTLSYLTGSNNLFYGAGSPLGIFSNSVAGDPMFAGLAANNFHLSAGSPAIDSGATVQLATDYDGVPRPQGAAYDIGAYEYPEASQSAGAAALAITTASLPSGVVGTAYSTTLAATGGTAPYTWTDPSCSGSCNTGMSFSTAGVLSGTPANAGTSTFTMTVADSAGHTASKQLSITIAAAASSTPAVSLSPASLTFTSQTVGTTSAAQTVTLKNTGTASLSISSIAASGNFAETTACLSSLPVGASCTISVTFTPTAAGTPTGAISITDNAAASPQAVSLSATAVAAASTLKITSTSLPAGTVGTAYSATLAATGGTAPYTWTDPSCSGACNTGMAFSSAGVLSGTPVNAGTSTFTFTVADSAGHTASAQLPITIAAAAAASTPAVSLSPTSLTFASQTVGTTSAAQTVTLKNTGTASLSISSIAASGNFAETTACPSSLPAGASCTISVTFTPTAAGTPTGSISITDNAAASPQAVSLSGTAVAAAASSGLAITTASLPAGTVGTAYSTTLAATGGTAPYAWTDPSCSGACNTGLALSAGVLSGTPANAGTSTFTFTVTDSAGHTASTQLSIMIAAAATGSSGSGAPSVALSWTAPSGTVSGYDVYRSTQSGTGYTLVNSSPAVSASYTDTTVSAGTTYYYVVTSVNSSGVQSSYSSQVTAAVPAS